MIKTIYPPKVRKGSKEIKESKSQNTLLYKP